LKLVPLLDVAPLSSERVGPFHGSRPYLATGDLGDDGELSPQMVTFENKPSRADLAVAVGDVCFARMAATRKVMQFDERHSNLILSTGFAILRPAPEKLDSGYLRHWLNLDSTQSRKDKLCSGATQKAITNEKIADLLIPIPKTLEEQRRIAAILDKAEALRLKRRKAIAKLDQLLRSAFIATFGDPMTNPKGWPLVELASYGEISTGNTPSRAVSENYGPGIEWMKSDNLNHEGDYVTDSEETLSAKGQERARVVPEGSILVTCIAGSFNCIGNLAIADRRVAFNQQINAIVPKESPSEFVYYLLKLGKPLIQAASTNSMKGMVSKSKFCAIRVPNPPVELQREFAGQFNRFGEVKRSMSRAALLQDALFSGLQRRAFSGAL